MYCIDSPNSDPAIIKEKLDTLIEENSREENSEEEEKKAVRLSQLYAFRGDYFYYYDPARAVDSYQTAIRLNNDNALAYMGLSTNAYERGKFDMAEKYARLAWEAAKWDTLLQANYADTLLAKGHYANDSATYYREASSIYDDAIARDPNYILTYHNAAAASRLIGNSEPWVQKEGRWVPGAQLYYEQLLDMLEDTQITSLDRNQGAYSFAIDKDQASSTSVEWTSIYLENPRHHQYYAYYGLALTLNLMGHTEDAESYVNKANELQIDPDKESDIKWLMHYDIDRLQAAQPQFSDKASQFRWKFLV